MKNILVTTDFSPESQSILRFVLELMKDTQCASRILLLNTYLVDILKDSEELLRINDKLKTISKLNLEKQKSEALIWVRNPNIQVVTASHMGSLANVITNLIKKEKIDLVAMGSAGGRYVDQIRDLLKSQSCQLLVPDKVG